MFPFKRKIDQLHKSIEDHIDNHSSIVNESHDQSNDTVPNKWSMGSLFNALRGNSQEDTADTDADLDNEKFGEYVSKQIQYHKPVSLMAGFVQVLGVFQYAPDIIKSSTFDTSANKIMFLNQSTNMDINNMTNEIPSESNDTNENGMQIGQTNLKKYFQSHFKFGTQDPDTTFDSTDVPTFNVQDFFEEYDNLPFLVIPQSLLFPELTLQPGEVKIFHFKSGKLPEDLCPSYKYSENLAINYYVEFGVNKVDTMNITPLFIKSPISISPMVTNKGLQYSAILGGKPHILEPGTIKEIIQPSNATRKQSVDLSSQILRRKSSVSIKQELPEKEIEKLKKSFLDVIKKTDNYDDIEDLVESQLDLQFDKKETSPRLDANLTNDSVEPKLIFNSTLNSTKENINDLKNQPLVDLISTVEATESDSNANANQPTLEPQLVNPQKNYIINRNGQRIATASFSKLFYSVTDNVNISIELTDNELLSVSGINCSLELIESISSDYINDSAIESTKKNNILTISSAHNVSFDKTGPISVKLTIPKTPMNLFPGQFKTNIFQVKWAVLIRFILIPKSASSNVFEFYGDKKGIFFHSSETIEGEEFDCRIPIPILPTMKEMGGW
ncbi:hypothetical protein C6P45_000310 [Maudiozyma exigua]|uniref:Uncharacterized protein n=1 Tax=Maudiozyma exigua TaxID=34358 RepID=A0A9P6W737_MAUEX|nr:hypothetical protein C6P45_000310 [Kazachstania exigua]